MHLEKKTTRMDIFIEENRKTILVQQRWKYDWVHTSGTTPWTYTQQKNFHNEVDGLIWNKWGGRFKVKVRGISNFAKKHAFSEFVVNFDIRWVLSGEHWKVNVTKIPPNSYAQSNVDWMAQKINLDTEDTSIIERIQNGVSYFQHPVAHEFGHAIGNSIYSDAGMHGDEYNTGSSFKLDRASIMNIGEQLRMRHIDYLLIELNKMISHTTFYARSI